MPNTNDWLEYQNQSRSTRRCSDKGAAIYVIVMQASLFDLLHPTIVWSCYAFHDELLHSIWPTAVIVTVTICFAAPIISASSQQCQKARLLTIAPLTMASWKCMVDLHSGMERMEVKMTFSKSIRVVAMKASREMMDEARSSTTATTKTATTKTATTA